ncbi:carbon-nitrogen hydrolase family protein [Cryobacterium sp. TMT1-3]|uniref:Carbon-nitrogen hydrolase family protein n=1 Tax=Cryobacterium luteum TaxID=1424661 RepID=A0A1H8K9E3_9MICO|nr:MULTISPECIES: carbon-nitrogen hydrolase family protein [Cryobacterium]TFB92369.1 carbon-nitrogen hydrolase family protein [Cryobacterium luteum]TFC25075.1 carbon-nitrogen hydrolase family protein [Cryobacterium sp. TMT1-3]SEN89038.1 Predicted amidohydrolase [Cryobacterium luteum]
MPRTVRIIAVQAAPHALGASLDDFASELHHILVDDPGAQFVVFPELHLFGTETGEALSLEQRNDVLRASAVPLDGELVGRLGAIARAAGVWLLPGSICERGPGGELFNTAVVFSPTGELVASYRKIFPWRPYEPYEPGDRFVVFDAPGIGRFGLSICYDAWFPEVTRHLAWMGAEVVLNIVKTTTPDRAQEVVLARANSIVNQTFTVSVNCAGPLGEGRSLIVDPEGATLAESTGTETVALAVTLDLDHVARVREHGTAGTNRLWAQFLPTDAPLELPLYAGRIDPTSWTPQLTETFLETELLT